LEGTSGEQQQTATAILTGCATISRDTTFLTKITKPQNAAAMTSEFYFGI
jgi:uncharacterized lipoprotein YajG